jgi:hypothetical protein
VTFENQAPASVQGNLSQSTGIVQSGALANLIEISNSADIDSEDFGIDVIIFNTVPGFSNQIESDNQGYSVGGNLIQLQDHAQSNASASLIEIANGGGIASGVTAIDVVIYNAGATFDNSFVGANSNDGGSKPAMSLRATLRPIPSRSSIKARSIRWMGSMRQSEISTSACTTMLAPPTMPMPPSTATSANPTLPCNPTC